MHSRRCAGREAAAVKVALALAAALTGALAAPPGGMASPGGFVVAPTSGARLQATPLRIVVRAPYRASGCG